jgi:predicted AlkP superfamily phosphohydrolase/phosphomutase
MIADPTVLIGLDGATFEVLDGLMQDGVMPFLKELVADGIRAELRSVIPALTPPAWTSLMTGRGPGRHGIFDFFRKESAHKPQVRLLTSRDVAGETVWTLASASGRRVTVLNFPLTFPPPHVAGFVVPGWMPWRQLKLGCYPADLYDRLKAQPGFDVRALAFDMELEEKAIEGCPDDEYERWIDFHIRREQHWFRILRQLMREDPCDLTAVLFDGVDKLQHLCWRFIAPGGLGPEPSPWEVRIRQRCLDYFRVLDGLIGEIVDLAGPRATTVLASDHGFGPQTATFFVNAWLEQRGHLAWAAEAPRPSDSAVLGIDQLGRHIYQLDWRRTTAYAATPSSNGIHIVVADEKGGPGVPAAEYDRLRRRLIEELYTVRDPASGEAIVRNVWTREEAFPGPFMDLAPDLTLVLRDGGLVSILASDVPVKPRPQPTGTHRPEGIFIASGPGLRRETTLPALSILDVAPLLLHCLGLPVPTTMEGRVPAEALTADARTFRPAESVESRCSATAGPAEPPQEPILAPEAEAEILRQLRALGYVE